MLAQFNVPYYDEGWDDITILKNDEKGYDPSELCELLEIPHDNPHHDGSIIEHIYRVQKAVHGRVDGRTGRGADRFPRRGAGPHHGPRPAGAAR